MSPPKEPPDPPEHAFNAYEESPLLSMSREERYRVLLEQDIRLRQQALDYGYLHEQQRKDPDHIAMNFGSASADALMAAMVEWRLGEGDPTPYLRWCVDDACLTLPYFNHERGPIDVSFGLFVLWDAMCAQRLLGEPVDPAFREAHPIPISERFQPDEHRETYVHVFDDLIQDLLDTAEQPEGWDAFIDWMMARKGTRQYVNTLKAYLGLIDAAKTGDRPAIEAALKTAEKAWNRRTGVYITWAVDKVLRGQMVDHRLACVIQVAERLSPAAHDLDSIHRWRWST